jgi:general L-amino acid transport system permease protein
MTTITSEVERPVSANLFKWVRRNLFNTWYNSLLTLLAIWILARFVPSHRQLAAGGKLVTRSHQPRALLRRPVPIDQLWRPAIGVVFVSFIIGLKLGRVARPAAHVCHCLDGRLCRDCPSAGQYGDTWPDRTAVLCCQYPHRAARSRRLQDAARQRALGHSPWPCRLRRVHLRRSRFPGNEMLPQVQTTRWGGLCSIYSSPPSASSLASRLESSSPSGRRSNLPVVKLFSTLFIELVRGVPLITILFLGSLLLPLFLPENVRIDRVIRAIIGITMFSAAYMAENVRGGLQAIPSRAV